MNQIMQIIEFCSSKRLFFNRNINEEKVVFFFFFSWRSFRVLVRVEAYYETLS